MVYFKKGSETMIVIAADHAGYELKEGLKAYFDKNNMAYKDLGTHSLESVDYPDYGFKIGEAIQSGDYEFGIAICGTGIGISIAANKVSGARAALVYDDNTAVLARQHNNANIIALGGRTTKLDDAIRYVNLFKNTDFEIRHQQRINKLNNYEGK
jgi:ribose 5-phosphate isomerase B